jgi:uncharacterized membrane protein
MRNLVAAAAFFLAIHFGVSGTALRARLVRSMGEKAYRGLFSLASLVGLIWLIDAYGDAPRVELWGQLLALKPIAAPLCCSRFCSSLSDLRLRARRLRAGNRGFRAMNLRGASSGSHAIRSCGASRSGRSSTSRSMAIWPRSILFGSLLVLAVGGTALIDRKRRDSFGVHWQRFALSTSNIPFAAIVGGRNQLGAALRETGIVRPLIAVAIYAAVFSFHARLFGAPAG